MRAEPIAATELSPADLSHWRDLAARAVEPNPFFEPDYVLALARGLDRMEDLRLLVVRDGGAWLACLPVHVARRWHRIPVRSLATWRGHQLYGLLGTPLVAPERTGDALAALLGAMPGSNRGARFAALEWVADDGPLAATFAELLGSRRPAPVLFERFERAVLRRRPESTYVEQTLNSKRRRELRRQRRKLGEEIGEEAETVDRAGEDAAYGEFIALEAAEKGERGTVIAAEPGHVSFFEEVCRAFAEQDRLQLLALQAGDQTVAMKCNLRAGSTVFCFKIAYDQRWSAFSPGILLELDMLKLFHENSDADLMDSCADHNNAMINRLWPDRRSLTTHLLPAGGLPGRVTRPVLTTAISLREHKHERKDR